MELYAKIYLYSTLNKAEVAQILSTLTDKLAMIDWSIVKNDDYDPENPFIFPDGFLFFPYLIELDAIDSNDVKAYIDQISLLLKKLWSMQIPAIISCDFEDQLPENGGYKSTAIPYPKT